MQAAFLYSFFFSSAILYTLMIAVSERTFLMVATLFLGLSFSSFIHVNKLQFGPTDTTRQHVLDRAVRSISFTSAELCFGFGCMYLERFPFFSFFDPTYFDIRAFCIYVCVSIYGFSFLFFNGLLASDSGTRGLN